MDAGFVVARQKSSLEMQYYYSQQVKPKDIVQSFKHQGCCKRHRSGHVKLSPKLPIHKL